MPVTVVNMIPKSLSGETQQDSEPNIAVNPENPLQIVGTAFTPDPLNGPRAPIYVPGMAFFAGSLMIFGALLMALRSFQKNPAITAARQ